MNSAPAVPPFFRPARTRAFTLVEVLIAAGIGVLVLGAVATLMVVSARLYYKNRMVSDAVLATRLVQEHLNKELSLAVNQTLPIAIHPTYADPGTNANAAALTPPPVRFGTVSYRVSLGTPARVVTDYAQDSGTDTPIVIIWPATADLPEQDDRFLLDSIALTDPTDAAPGIRIARSTRSGGTVSVFLASRIIDGNHTGDTRVIKVNDVTLLQRVRRYETNHAVAGDAQRCELQWFASPHATAALLTSGVDAQNRFLFAPVPDALADEQAVSWAFAYLNPERARHLLLGRTEYFQTNYAEGLVMPKSGNPLSPQGTPGNPWTPARISTTLYSTTTTTSLGTSTTKQTTTTTKATSTTKKTTTTTVGTTTTTVGTTTTTLGTTIRSTTTKGTSTTKRTTTTTLGTTTVKQSTTTTTKGTTTTAQSTTTKATTTIQGD